MADKVYCETSFLSLKSVKTKDYEYFYSHDSRCDGQIVSLLPVSYDEGILVRKEFTPCWGEGQKISSITGGWEKSKHSTVLDTAIDELEEEAGYIVPLDRYGSLGTCKGSKSNDATYHLFVVDLTDYGEGDVVKTKPQGDGSHLETHGYCEWAKFRDIATEISDPLLYVLYIRWVMTGFNFPRMPHDPNPIFIF